MVKNPAVKTYKDLNLHLNPLLADNKDVEAARVSKFLNGDKLDISAALSNAAEICHGNRKTPTKTPTKNANNLSVLASNRKMPTKRVETAEKMGATGPSNPP